MTNNFVWRRWLWSETPECGLYYNEGNRDKNKSVKFDLVQPAELYRHAVEKIMLNKLGFRRHRHLRSLDSYTMD